MPDAPRILQVVTDRDRRGAQVFATDLHRALEELGHPVRTVALAPGLVGGLDLAVLGTRRLAPATLLALRRASREFDVVIAHGSSTLPACSIALLGTGTPFVYRQISDSMFWASTAVRRARVRLGMQRAAAIVALWSGAADTLSTRLGVPRPKIHIVPNGVTPERFAPASPAERRRHRISLGLDPELPVVAYVGALAHEKGVDLAVDAVASLADVQLLVAGDGPERQALEQRADTRSRAPGRVTFTGSLPDARVAYAAADIVVLPSRGGDSMPATLIEAGLMGVPAISTPVEGIPDIVADGETGLLVPRDDVAALRNAVQTLLTDPSTRERLGHAGRTRCVERFGIDAVARRWSAVVDAVSA